MRNPSLEPSILLFLFDGYDPGALERIRVVKVYPCNDFVNDEYTYTSPFVNDFMARLILSLGRRGDH